MKRRTAAACVASALLLAACSNPALSDESARDGAGRIVEAGDVGTARLLVGDCFNEKSSGEVQTVRAVPCTSAHHGQVVGRVEADPSAVYPGVEALREQALDRCSRLSVELTEAALSDSSLPEIALSAYVPVERAWDSGDRSIVCWLDAAAPIVVNVVADTSSGA